MPSDKAREFCDRVLSHVKYRGVHRRIRDELLGHIEDHMLCLTSSGMDKGQAEEKAIQAMGDPDFIGEMLNRQHKPWIICLYYITNTVVIIWGVYIAYILAVNAWLLLSGLNASDVGVDGSQIRYSRELEDQGVIDARTIKLEYLAVLRDQSVRIRYSTYFRNPLIGGWSFPGFTSITDNCGTEYEYSTFGRNGLIKSVFIIQIDEINPDASSLFLHYNRYNRSLLFEIPLPKAAGENAASSGMGGAAS